MLLVVLRLSYLNLKERGFVNPEKNKNFYHLLHHLSKST
ncbi:MAG: hypothetical protein JETT_0388 [Candidatus Jettenia ecosi]|uniref:Uncharacterized protein n=1 Tax=Candidatus Jettenia ecosi TaxID=2494326 RepID=A0A533QF33_9BACT|nr:MAG: hypothetical protein JETT_0388 [Candidatus Jettenia ecosi]